MEITYVEAGYGGQEWLTPDPNDPVVGEYECDLGFDEPLAAQVTYLATGPSGQPEFKVEREDGFMVTVLASDVVKEYLAMFNATKRAQGGG